MPSNINFRAVPSYTPGHEFSGRVRELQTIADWAVSPVNPVLVLEAIGGMGKSMLCWQWVKHEAQKLDREFAGIFWYSFYERGADMSDFCAHALAFLTSGPVDEYKNRKTTDLASELMPVLRKRPWLFVLDGLERVLVAYNRYDAAQVRDEELEGQDQSSKRKAQDCIRPADSNVLVALTDVFPSKVLISSRLMPSAFLDSGGHERAGVLHEVLSGLDPSDAEAMLRRIGVTGDSSRIRRYLTKNFACHPLIVGVVGGLVSNFAKARGDFDHWVDYESQRNGIDSEADIVRSRNRILWAAFEDIGEDSRTLLARMALVSETIDDGTLLELNPTRPDRPPEVYPPSEWLLESSEFRDQYHEEQKAYDAYLEEVDRWKRSFAIADAERWLREIVQDLASRGLIQWDRQANTYDLHPVVRGYAVNSIAPERRNGVAQRVVNHFSSRGDIPSEQVTNVNDLRNGLQVARTLLHLGRVEQAADAILDLASALFWSLEAWDIFLALARPLFPNGWTEPVVGLDSYSLSWLWNDVALSLSSLGKASAAVTIEERVLELAIGRDDLSQVQTALRNLAVFSSAAYRMDDVHRFRKLVVTAATILGDEEDLALSYLGLFETYSASGDFAAAEDCWRRFDELPRPKRRGSYRSGFGEYCHAWLRFLQGQLDEDSLAKAEQLGREANSRWVLRALHELRGEWKLSFGQWAEAVCFFEENVKMTREANMDASWSEARLTLAQLKLGLVGSPVEIADRIATVDDPPHAALAELYLALRENEKARHFARTGYLEAWSAGPPYIYWRPLQQCRRVFEALGDPEPQLAPFSPDNLRPLTFESKLLAYLEQKQEEKRTGGESVSQYIM